MYSISNLKTEYAGFSDRPVHMPIHSFKAHHCGKARFHLTLNKLTPAFSVYLLKHHPTKKQKVK